MGWILTKPVYNIGFAARLAGHWWKEEELQFAHLTNLSLLPRKDYLGLEQN